MENVITVKNIHKSFGTGENAVEVLKDINFGIKKGEFVSIMGASGCGKSTLLYLIGGLDTPSSGNILIGDKDINTLKDKEKSKIRRCNIGFVFQFYNLVQNLTIEENIMLPLIMEGKKAKDYKNELDEILITVGLESKRKSVPSKLSGGQQQRAAIARAIISSPDIILADEPIGNLDSNSGTEIMNLFKKINTEKNITVLQVTHSPDASLYGNRIITLKDGVILEDKQINAVNN